jgi:hypothetical protein
MNDILDDLKSWLAQLVADAQHREQNVRVARAPWRQTENAKQ